MCDLQSGTGSSWTQGPTPGNLLNKQEYINLIDYLHSYAFKEHLFNVMGHDHNQLEQSKRHNKA